MKKTFLIIFLVLGFWSSSLWADEEGNVCLIGPTAENSQKGFGVEGFIGEEFEVSQAQFSNVDKLYLTLNFPAGYKLLSDEHPVVRLFTPDKSFDQTFEIKSTVSEFSVGKEVSADTLFMELSLFYCRDGSKELCLSKHVMYKFPVQQSDKPGSLAVTYNVPVLEGT